MRIAVLRIASRAVSMACLAFLAIAMSGCSESVEELERAAMARLAKGDRISATIHLKELLSRDAQHAEAHYQLGRILAEVSRPEAGDSLRRALELGKPPEEVMPVLGPVLLEAGKLKELLDLLEPDPKRARPMDAKGLAEFAVLRGLTFVAQGDLTSANTQLQLASSVLPEKAKLGLARLALASKDREQAEARIKEVIESNPANAEAHLALAESRRATGNLAEALTHYAEAGKLDPGSVNILLLHAVALINADRVADARPMLDKVNKLAPPGPVSYFAQALIECKEQRYRECSDTLDKVFDIVPLYKPALLLAGQLNYATGNLEKSMAAYLRYLESAPADPHARKLLAGTLLAQSNAPAALRILRPLLTTNKNDAQLLGLVGQAMLQLGNVRQASESLASAVKLAPGNPEFRTALALTHLAAGLRRGAEAEFRAAIRLKPNNGKADFGLIMLLLGDKKVPQAREAVAGLEQRLPQKAETHMLKGVVSRAGGDVGAARKAFERALQIDANYFPAIQELADIDLEAGKQAEGRARIDAVLQRNSTHLDAMLAMARIEFRAGRRAEGLAWARQAADAHPQSPNALLMVVEAQADAGEMKEAIGSAQLALKLRPRDPKLLLALGHVQLAAKDYSGAALTFTTLVGLQPGSTEAHLLLASAYVMAGDAKTAIAVSRTALKRNPRSLQAMTLVGDMLLEGKKYPEALEFARQVQQSNPKLALGFRLEGDALLAQGDSRRAVKAFEAAAKLGQTGPLLVKLHRAQAGVGSGTEREAPLEEWLRANPDDSATRTYLSEVLTAKGRHKEAAVHYEQLARRNPKDARTLNNLAWALHSIGDASALQYAEQAYRLKPGEAAVLDTYGWILVQRGKLHEGIQILLQAVAIDGKDPEIRYHLAKGLAQAGDKARARIELKRVLSSGKSFPHADDARALLASLGS